MTEEIENKFRANAEFRLDEEAERIIRRLGRLNHFRISATPVKLTVKPRQRRRPCEKM
jgi:hypothetical protein